MNKIQSMLVGQPFIEEWDDVKELPFEMQNHAAINDFTTANFGHGKSGTTPTGKPDSFCVLVPSLMSDGSLNYYHNGSYSYHFPPKTRASIAPALRINLPPELSKQSDRAKVFGCKTYVVRCSPYSNKRYLHEVNIIAFDSIRGPRIKADKQLSRKLQELLDQGRLKKSGRTYTGCGKEEFTYRQLDSYIYGNREFVYMEALSYDGRKYLDGSKSKYGEMIFVEVLPIPFIIRSDWHKLPKYINPQGTGELNVLVLRQEELAIAGVPYTSYGNICWGNHEYDYNDDLCKARLYVENNYVQEFFRDDEDEKYATTTFKQLECEM